MCACVCVHVCVRVCVRVCVCTGLGAYGDTNVYNDMGMTEILQCKGSLWGHCPCPCKSKGLQNILNVCFVFWKFKNAQSFLWGLSLGVGWYALACFKTSYLVCFVCVTGRPFTFVLNINLWFVDFINVFIFYRVHMLCTHSCTMDY